MKITFLLTQYSWKPVGAFRCTYELANHLVCRGHEVNVVHPARRVKFTYHDNTFYWKCIFLAKTIRDSLLTPKKIKWQFVDQRVKLMYVPTLEEFFIPDADVVLSCEWYTAHFANSYSAKKGEKFFYIRSCQADFTPPDKMELAWNMNMHKIVVSKWLLEKTKEFGIHDAMHIPDAVNHEAFCLKRPIEKRTQYLSMMSSDLKLKGTRDGFTALFFIHKRFPCVPVLVFGLEPGISFIPPWVRFIRNPSQETLVNDIYNASSIFICPSLSEGWGLPGAEAMACGCALVSTDCGGVRDYAIDGQTALLSPPGDPKQLADNAIRLLLDDEHRMRLAKQGREHILNFRWENSAMTLEDLLKKYV